LAAQHAHVDGVRCLVNELGASLNLITSDDRTPVYVVAQFGRLDILRFFLNECGCDVDHVVADDTLLVGAAAEGHLDVVQCLVTEFGAGPNQADGHGVAPVLEAAHNGHVEVLRYFIKECGADIHQNDNNGEFPLFLAA
jgi:ankyrin repeat protein